MTNLNSQLSILHSQLRKGFTLTELLLTVAIITIVSTFSVAFYGRFLTQSAVTDTVDRLVGNTRKAQMYAMSGKGGTNWGVNIAGQTMTFYRGTSFGTKNSAFDEIYSINNTVTVTGISDLNFMRMTGTPSSSLTITISDTNNNSKTVTVNSQGVTYEQ